ncbi:hypothetical protein RF11_08782 [Thelohanellus kitauei]|uniref:Uncharacterized protein n=1 Tax=Thelohanellus kitauei TaxID=669202 RepID=A0A0C2MVA8_THEKT|nr:hypothetical protein RF11_08782 [Thelohanellus kitauei]
MSLSTLTIHHHLKRRLRKKVHLMTTQKFDIWGNIFDGSSHCRMISDQYTLYIRYLIKSGTCIYFPFSIKVYALEWFLQFFIDILVYLYIFWYIEGYQLSLHHP